MFLCMYVVYLCDSVCMFLCMCVMLYDIYANFCLYMFAGLYVHLCVNFYV